MDSLQPPRDERGATAVEYALMISLIAIVIIAGVSLFGVSVNDLYSIPANTIDGP